MSQRNVFKFGSIAATQGFTGVNFMLIKGVPKKVSLSELRKFVSKSLNKITNHPFKDIYDKIYTIGYYSGFYSYLTNKN
jgi:hypothetical protein